MEFGTELKRRSLLQGVAGLMVAAMGTMRAYGTTGSAHPATERPAGKLTGKGIGDFDFLAGEWTIKHRRLKDGTTDKWEDFASGATVHRVLDGMASIEELRAPSGKYMGMGVRVWHPEEEMWADHWTSTNNGIVNAPQMGRFVDGEGVFVSDDEIDGRPIKARGVWDRLTPKSCRWHQSSSTDGGKTWSYNWYMDWTRV